MTKFATITLAITATLWLLISSILGISAITEDFAIHEAPYDMVAISGLSEQELKYAFTDTVHYLYDGRAKLDTKINDENLFNQKEIKHMQEVKAIFQFLIGTWVALTLLLVPAFILFFKKIKPKLPMPWSLRFITRYFFAVFIFLALIGIGIAFFFEPLFITFHQVVFDNDDWLLSLTSDHLIQFLPEQFFFKRALQIALTFTSIFSLVTLTAYLSLKRQQKRVD